MQIAERLAKETTRDYALRILKYNIIMLELKPGSIVSENELATEIGVSRTPVREALIELSKTQIVEIYPQKGSVVSKIRHNLIEEARFLRLVLENAVVELACDYASESDLEILKESIKLQEFYTENYSPDKLLEEDNKFHKYIFEICNKVQTYSLMDSMTAHFDRVRNMSLHTVKDIKIVEDHKKIVSAIENKDKEKAKAFMTKHLSRYQIDKDEIMEKYPDYF
ncbi:transcriptional regulator, GntR family [Alkaliphilus metalliredigens QYMF]|uniref:Transcriptional regulator, GntR family n=1 Tax=Alkaliphilus metalliredigens (strain QYMF) TaxID=293826 RepID=A6TMT1_ALKMQ|nr:GntR family transcriptional regulator [Alkaliphilus metalliredigens]ABR47499.1 transcriptional regulator, GntR family [Alkaliphilus metalliredigens QYMF]